MSLLLSNRKLFTSLFLSSLILYNTLRVSFTYIYYNLDPIGFIEELCENKDTPELQCNGKCHLKKVMETSQQSENKPIHLIEFKDVILYSQNISEHEFLSVNLNRSLFDSYINNYKFLVDFPLFHPPKV